MMRYVAEPSGNPVGWAEWIVKGEGTATVVARCFVTDPRKSAESTARLFAASPDMRDLLAAAAAGEEIGVRAAALLERL